jgi:hypothetical protein
MNKLRMQTLFSIQLAMEMAIEMSESSGTICECVYVCGGRIVTLFKYNNWTQPILNFHLLATKKT